MGILSKVGQIMDDAVDTVTKKVSEVDATGMVKKATDAAREAGNAMADVATDAVASMKGDERRKRAEAIMVIVDEFAAQHEDLSEASPHHLTVLAKRIIAASGREI